MDGAGLTATGLAISAGSGTLVDNGDGTWTYTPALNDDTAVSFSYTVTDGSLTAAGTRQPRHHPGQRRAGDDAGDAWRRSPRTAAAPDHPGRAAGQRHRRGRPEPDGHRSWRSAAGSGTLVDNGNGTWTYTPALNDDTAVSFSYTVTDGSLGAAGSASLDITPVNDAPVTTPVTLAADRRGQRPRLITQAELLANATRCGRRRA